MWGGVSFDEKQPWYLDADKLYENNLVELSVLKFPPPTSFDSLADVADIAKYTTTYKALLLPRFRDTQS